MNEIKIAAPGSLPEAAAFFVISSIQCPSHKYMK